jgi:glycosyltransferase involved in cell wall biosynthesis
MKIVLLSPGHPYYDKYPGGGGLQQQIAGIAPALAGMGHEVHVICRGAESSLFANSGVIFHSANPLIRDEIGSVLIFSAMASQIIERLRPDVIVGYERFSAYFPSKMRFPFVFSAQNYDAFVYYGPEALAKNPLNLFVHPWKMRLEEGVMKRSALVVAPTKSVAEYLSSRRINRVEVIPNGISCNLYQDLGDERYVLYAGRLDRPKRVDLLIDAYAESTDLHGRYRLMIVGRGPEKKRLQSLVRKRGISGEVIFRDWAEGSEFRALLGNSTVFVLPSEYETFGIALVEAMACGKPVIAAAIPGPMDIVENGVNGLLFETGSVDSLRKALNRCIEDTRLRNRIAGAAKLTVESNFELVMVVEKMIRTISQALEN